MRANMLVWKTNVKFATEFYFSGTKKGVAHQSHCTFCIMTIKTLLFYYTVFVSMWDIKMFVLRKLWEKQHIFIFAKPPQYDSILGTFFT